MQEDIQIEHTKGGANKDVETSLAAFKKEENNADNKWEEVKDKVSGVDKEIEQKLASGTIQPSDTQNLGD